jgi:hypothetical protein
LAQDRLSVGPVAQGLGDESSAQRLHTQPDDELVVVTRQPRPAPDSEVDGCAG